MEESLNDILEESSEEFLDVFQRESPEESVRELMEGILAKVHGGIAGRIPTTTLRGIAAKIPKGIPRGVSGKKTQMLHFPIEQSVTSLDNVYKMKQSKTVLL